MKTEIKEKSNSKSKNNGKRPVSHFVRPGRIAANFDNFQNSFFNGTAFSSADSTRDLYFWSPSRKGADREIAPAINNLRWRSRDLFKNSTFGKSALSTLTDNIIGSGLNLQPNIDREYVRKKTQLKESDIDEIEDEIEFHFKNWSKSQECDLENKLNFYQIQWLAMLSQLMSGDVFCTLPILERRDFPYKLKLQLIESDRIRSPFGYLADSKIRMGIKYNEFNEAVKYYIYKGLNPGYYELNNDLKSFSIIDAYGKKSNRKQILHIFKPERPGQGRGIPILSTVMETIKRLSRYQEAESVASVVRALYNIFIKSNNSTQYPGGLRIDDSENAEDEQDQIFLGVGEVHNLAPGEEIFESNPNRPNPTFETFVNALAKEIGMATDIPYEILIKQFMASYSASRASRLEFWKSIIIKRSWFADQFCSNIYKEFLNLIVLEGIINLPGYLSDPFLKMAYQGSFWRGPGMGQIDELKEVNAATKRIENNISTYSDEISAYSGKSAKDVFKKLRKELTEIRDLTILRKEIQKNLSEIEQSEDLEVDPTNKIDEEE